MSDVSAEVGSSPTMLRILSEASAEVELQLHGPPAPMGADGLEPLEAQSHVSANTHRLRPLHGCFHGAVLSSVGGGSRRSAGRCRRRVVEQTLRIPVRKWAGEDPAPSVGRVSRLSKIRRPGA